MIIEEPSVRAEIVTRRTYCRPKDNGEFETWEDVIERVIVHQRWLWERALTFKVLPEMSLHDLTEDMLEWVHLNKEQEAELWELWELLIHRRACPSGRTLWLGGTKISKRREASMFNCSHTNVETVWDMVDVLWLLLQGCGVGFTPITGTLSGFRNKIDKIRVVHSKRTGKGGIKDNSETFEKGVWTLKIGDSAEAWAKSIGKLLAGKYKAHTLIFDFSEIRPAGYRLKGYGWISSGDASIAVALPAIAKILNHRAGNILQKIDILDIVNWLGTILSSRRSAEIALVEYGSDEWREFAVAKKNAFTDEFKHRQQSNNSLVFYKPPSFSQLEKVFDIMIESGGSEPGIINGEAALRRAPWFKGVNPCAEILLGSKSFCNLVEVDLSKFRRDPASLHRAMHIAARMNYRQTVVDFRDGILQESWHLNNEFLRLCGVGVTGIIQRADLTEYDWKNLRYSAVNGARTMAKELGLQYPKNVTTVKPSGTLSKIMDTTEGIHKPLGKYIFNWINFSAKDPIINKLSDAGYKCIKNPNDDTGIIACIPVKFDNIEFDKVTTDFGELYVNQESAFRQLERYKMVQLAYCDQNVSNTISYLPDEIPGIIGWLLENWDIYVGVSFLPKVDGTKPASYYGYAYLPQEVVSEQRYKQYVEKLKRIDWSNTESYEELKEDECATGVCPIK